MRHSVALSSKAHCLTPKRRREEAGESPFSECRWLWRALHKVRQGQLRRQSPPSGHRVLEGQLGSDDGAVSFILAPVKGSQDRGCQDVSTLTDLSYSADLPEVELVSLLSEGLPSYTLRADCVFGYEHSDWLHTPLVPPDTALCLTPQQIEETLKYLLLCSERVGQVTKTYHDIDAVTHLLEERERDLELAARIGQSLLKQNGALTERSDLLHEQLEAASEEIAQLRHDLSMREDLLQLYASAEEREPSASDADSTLRRNESSSSLSNYIHYDFLQRRLQGLEEENLKLHSEASQLTWETTNYEEQEQQLMMDCVKELTSTNKQVVLLSDELARKVEDTLRQQEEISALLSQIVDLQQRRKLLSTENEVLTRHLNAARESQSQLRLEVRGLRDKYSQSEEMLREAWEEVKNLRSKILPNSTVNCYSTLAAGFPPGSLAAEIEGSMRRGLDSATPAEYKNHPWRVFETVKAVNQVARLRSRCHSPQTLGSSPLSASSRRTSNYGSDSASVTLEDKPPAGPVLHEDRSTSSGTGEKRLGQPGTPGGQDLEVALRHLCARQESHASERPFFEVERERKLRALASRCRGSSGSLTPSDSVLSTGTNYSGSSRHSSASGSGSRSCLPDRLQIVKPLEGSATLQHWQRLARPDLGGVLHPRPGVLTKDFRELEVDLQHVYSLNDLEEDEPDFSPLLSAGLASAAAAHGNVVTRASHNLPQTAPTHTVTTCRILHPSLPLAPLLHSLRPRSVSSCGSSEHLRPTPLPPLHTEPPDDLRGPAHTTTPACLGLLGLLQELGISASACPPPVTPQWNFPPTGTPLTRQPTARLGCSIPCTVEGGQPPDGKVEGNIFSLNLVGKLQSLGLDKVVARGIISPK
ncbi:hypothetical protein AAFF_G00261000 [Aldrovandia affinis]|uniref:Trafficking kinesin-binding protein 1-like n=1 Tax=Aldrovandia affinis TaxID=143900 RepID=A0AAD7RBT1_9TELE|nr:hypothetical protein AAFF_G00261000 [Aldrovandia affinis]